MNWKFFVGSSIVVVGALLPYAPLPAIAAGVALAALFNWLKLRGGARKTDTALTKGR